MADPVDALRNAAESTPERVAIRAGSGDLTYVGLLAAAGALAHALRDGGIQPGDRVALALPNTPDHAVAHYATLIAGAIVVPLNPTLAAPALTGRLLDAQPGVLLTGREPGDAAVAAAAHAGVDLMDATDGHAVRGARLDPQLVEPDDTAMVTYKAADDEQPLGVALSRRALGWSASAAAGVLGLSGDDTLACYFPLFHPLGQTYGLGASVAAGCTLMIPPPGEAGTALHTSAKAGATVLGTFPILAAQATGGAPTADDTDRAVRTVFCSGGRALPQRARERLASSLGCEVLEGYGPIETAALGCAWQSGRPATSGSMGPAVPGVELAVVDAKGRKAAGRKAGQLLARGPNVMTGYWGRPEDTARAFDNGWLLTGDKARTDDEGNVYLLDGVLWTDSFRRRETGRGGLFRRKR